VVNKRMLSRNSTEPLISIQILRAIAALAVTIAHTHAENGWFALYLGHKDNMPTLVTGAAGVDLFFVISGFVMVYSSAKMFGSRCGPAKFLSRRIVRIVPLYWIMTTFLLWYWTHVGNTWAMERMSVKTVWCSYLFIPCVRPDGSMDPVLGVGWTLDFEMFFYLLFGLIIFWPRRAAVLGLSVAMVGLVVYDQNVSLPTSLALLLSPLLLEFVGGMLIAFAYQEGLRVRFPWLLMAAGGAVIGATGFWGFSGHRELVWGIPAALIVMGAVSAGEPPVPNRMSRLLAFIGDTSYALYLTHGIVMLAVRSDALPIATVVARWPWAYAGVLVILSVAIGAAVHLGVERPITGALRRLITTRRDGEDLMLVDRNGRPIASRGPV
jgi:exopolysaccharide production protein ExoZ